MARYELRRPSPIKVSPRHVRRQDPIVSAMPITAMEEKELEEFQEEEEVDDLDSPFSSPSTIGGDSSSEDSDSDSDSDDEEPLSPLETEAPAPATDMMPNPTPSLPPPQTEGDSMLLPMPVLTISLVATSSDSSLPETTSIPLTMPTSTPINTPTNAPISNPTNTPISTPLSAAISTPTRMPTLMTTTRPSIPATIIEKSSLSGNQKQPTMTIVMAPPPGTAESGTASASELPEMSIPQREEPPIISKAGIIAAATLGVLGALALIIAAVVCIKHRKRKQQAYTTPLADDAFNPSNTESLRAPQTAHIGSASSIFNRLSGDNNGGEPQLDRSAAGNNMAAGTLVRAGSAPTAPNSSRPPPTPNPFADPPLNKAYDVLNNRPRSTTLTDRGSWTTNPFRDPESERFDPFGELKERARQERIKYATEARREVEYERQKQKERMGLAPDGLPIRPRGSGEYR